MLACLMSCVASGARADSLADAEKLLLRGNYEESEAAFQLLLGEHPVRAALGIARSLRQRGLLKEANQQLQRSLEQSPDSADLHAELADLALERGEVALADEHVRQAIRLEADHLQARWLRAELARMRGQMADAQQAYRWLAEFYDKHGHSIDSPRELYWLGQGIAQHARFNRDSSRFPQLVSKLYPAALKLQPNFWPAQHAVGLLLLEKFNEADAGAALGDALQINPHSAEIHTALAQLTLEGFQFNTSLRHIEQAVKINPVHLPALWCRADVQLASLLPNRALATLQKARELNPHSIGTLGRIAACHTLLPASEDAPKQNKAAQPAEFYVVWAEALDRNRRFPLAAERLRKVIDLQPERIGPRGRLGMIEMRLGHEERAQRLLAESFAIDPYNVRVKNQLEVLDLLGDYTTIETKHFSIRFDSNAPQQQYLVRRMAEAAEQIYDEFSETFQFELPEKALLEIFSKGRGAGGRQWFGARMAGLPDIHTIAACSGNVVAFASLSDSRRHLNWHDILRHELVHLFNLQQTQFNVPHWFTEGCAVWLENRPRRQRWEQLLVKRAAEGRLLDLTTIDLGFIRPRSAGDRQLAYCQAELCIECLLSHHGPNSLRKMLAAYQQNLPTHLAVKQALGITAVQFEREYQAFLGKVIEKLSRRRGLRPLATLADATRRHAATPADPAAGAELALARLRQGDYPEATRLAAAVLEEDLQHSLANYVQAQLLVRKHDTAGAIGLLTPNMKLEKPDPASVELLAGLHLRLGNIAEAAEAYRLGAQLEPDNLTWTKALAVVAVKTKNNTELASLLTRIAREESDNLVARKKRLQLAIRAGNQDDIAHWSEEVLHIDPSNESARKALSDAGQNQIDPTHTEP